MVVSDMSLRAQRGNRELTMAVIRPVRLPRCARNDKLNFANVNYLNQST